MVKIRKKLRWPLAACALAFALFLALALMFAGGKPEAETLDAGGAPVSGAAVAEGGYLFAARDNSLLFLSRSGEKLWEDKGLSNAASALAPLADGKRAYVASGNRIYLYDLADGARISSIERYDNGGSVVFSNIAGLALSADETLLAVSHGSSKTKHYLTVLRLDDGGTVFHTAVGITSQAVLFSGDAVVLGQDSGRVRAYHVQTGAVREVRLSDDVKALASYDGYLYAATVRGMLAKISADAFEVEAEYDLSKKSGLVAPSAIAVSEAGVFVAGGTDDRLYALTHGLGYRSALSHADDVTGVLIEDGRVGAVVSGRGLSLYDAARAARGGNALFWVFLALAVCCGLAALALLVAFFERSGRLAARVGSALWHHRTAYLMLLPIFALLALFSFYPIVIAAVRAFTDWSSASQEIKFIGFDNFVMMVREGYFLIGVKNLLIFLASYIAKILTVPLLVAVMVYSLRSDRFKYFYRFLFVVPMVVPSVVSALMWKNIYDPNFGLLNELLKAVGLERYQTTWLNNPKTVIPALIFVGFPFVDAFSFLIYYSAMVNIPASVLEAAQLDGASPARKFFALILPLIASQIKILIMLGFINQIQDFNLILLLTSGGPGTDTYVPGYELYLNATTFGRYGYACALGLVMFVVIFIGTIVMNKVKVSSDLDG